MDWCSAAGACKSKLVVCCIVSYSCGYSLCALRYSKGALYEGFRYGNAAGAAGVADALCFELDAACGLVKLAVGNKRIACDADDVGGTVVVCGKNVCVGCFFYW